MAVAVRSHAVSTPASSTTCTVGKPSGLTAGDLMIAHITARNDRTISNPSGSWNNIRSETISGVLTSHLAWKIADAGDVAASNFSFGLGSSAVHIGAITAFTGHDPTTPIGDHDGTATGSNTTTISAAAITPTVASSMICFFATCGGENGSNTIGSYSIPTSNPTWSEQYEAFTDLGNDLTMSMARGIRTATTSTGTGTATFDISRNNIGQLIAVSPAPTSITSQIPSASIEIDSHAPTAKYDQYAQIPAASIEIDSHAPTTALSDNKRTEVPSAEIEITAQTPSTSLTDNKKTIVPVAEIEIEAAAPATIVTTNFTSEPPAAEIEISSHAPETEVTADKVSQIPAGEIEITGQTPTTATTAHVTSQVPAGEIEIEGKSPTTEISGDQTSLISSAQIEIDAHAPSTAATDHKASQVPSASIELDAHAPQTRYDQISNVPADSIEIEGQAPATSYTDNRTSQIPSASIEIEGKAPTVVVGGEFEGATVRRIATKRIYTRKASAREYSRKASKRVYGITSSIR